MLNDSRYNSQQNSTNYQMKIENIERRGIILERFELNDLTIIYLRENSYNDFFNIYIVAKDHMKNGIYFQKCIQAIFGENIGYSQLDDCVIYINNVQIMSEDDYSYNKNCIINKCIYLSQEWLFIDFKIENFIFTNYGIIYIGINDLLLKNNLDISSPLYRNILQDFSNVFFGKENLFIDAITHQPVLLDKIQSNIELLKIKESQVKCIEA